MYVAEEVELPEPVAAPSERLDWARRIAFMRRAWTNHLDAELVSGPAKDMFIGLYIAEKEGRRLTVHELATIGETPPTTGLRWINTLVQRGMVLRVPDPTDRRRAFIHLTDRSRSAIEAYLDQVIEEIR